MDEYIRLDTTIIGIDSLINKAPTAEEAKVLFTAKDVIYSQQRYVMDVQPLKRGRWIEKPPYKDETVKGLEFQIVCSECDEQNCSLEFDENYNAIGKTFYRTRYCPNCGARMDLKDGGAE